MALSYNIKYTCSRL